MLKCDKLIIKVQKYFQYFSAIYTTFRKAKRNSPCCQTTKIRLKGQSINTKILYCTIKLNLQTLKIKLNNILRKIVFILTEKYPFSFAITYFKMTANHSMAVHDIESHFKSINNETNNNSFIPSVCNCLLLETNKNYILLILGLRHVMAK